MEDIDIEMDGTSALVTNITDLDDIKNDTNNNNDNNISEMKTIDNIKMVSDAEQRELALLWDKMKEFEKFESGNTNESLHRKHLRFTMEKEFVEMLSNPQYLHRFVKLYPCTNNDPCANSNIIIKIYRFSNQ